jgi:8-oxo-dGTP pyrophosphatase MutT (NUDIX family)
VLSDQDLRARLSAPAAGSAPSDDGIDLAAGAPRIPAAVLVGITGGPAAGVLLTRRTAHLRRHSGQVSFPGGRIDPSDLSPEAAALREAQEEIGLDPALVEPLGRLPDHHTSTGFTITPVTALLRPGFAADAVSDEVDAVFTLPLATLLDPSAPQRRRLEFAGAWREFWVWPHPEFYIWGATAAILVRLADILKTSK